MPEQALVGRLEAEVGAAVGHRIYPLLAPQAAALPWITYQRASTSRPQSLRGPVGLVDPRLQVDCWAQTYPGVKALADQVRQALDGYTDGNVYALILSERDLTDADGGRYRVSMDFSWWQSE